MINYNFSTPPSILRNSNISAVYTNNSNNNINNNTPTIRQTPRGRTVYEPLTHELPSVENTTEDPDLNITHPDMCSDKLRSEIRQHAYQRIQTFYARAVSVYGLGRRTDPQDSSQVEVGIDPARIQVGRGNRYWDASHSDAASGLYDNRRTRIGHEILNEHKISPNKRGILRAKSHKKYTDNDINELLNLTNNPEQFWKRFDELWTPSKYNSSNIIEDSYVGLAINITSLLPKALNRVVDKGLELEIRPIYAMLMKDLMLAQKNDPIVNPEQITQLYQVAVKNHFTFAEQGLRDRIKDLTNCLVLIEKLERSCCQEEQKKLIVEIDEIQQKLSKIVHLGVPTVTTQKIPDLFAEKINTDKDSAIVIKQKYNESIEFIKSKTSRKLNKMKCYLLFTEEENNGTKLPEFTFLSGTFNTDTKILSPSNQQNIQSNQSLVLQPHNMTKMKNKVRTPLVNPIYKKLKFNNDD